MIREAIESEWFYWVRLFVKVTLVFAVFYVAYDLYQRHLIRQAAIPEEAATIDLPEDMFVFIPKSYVADAERAHEKLVGKPLWVKEGYRWTYEPGDTYLAPLERIVPTAVILRDGQARLVFEKEGRDVSVSIGTQQRVYIDDMFFVKDPREIYDHWTDEMWRTAADGRVAVGMSEIQVAFALGVGEVSRTSPGGMTRILDYKQCAEASLQPVRVTYVHHIATSIEPL